MILPGFARPFIGRTSSAEPVSLAFIGQSGTGGNLNATLNNVNIGADDGNRYILIVTHTMSSAGPVANGTITVGGGSTTRIGSASFTSALWYPYTGFYITNAPVSGTTATIAGSGFTNSNTYGAIGVYAVTGGYTANNLFDSNTTNASPVSLLAPDGSAFVAAHTSAFSSGVSASGDGSDNYNLLGASVARATARSGTVATAANVSVTFTDGGTPSGISHGIVVIR